MLVPQHNLIDVPLVEAVVLTIREGSGWERVFFFENLTANVLTLTLQQSLDGGVTWTDVVFLDTSANPFTVLAAGVAGAVVFKHHSTPGLLRLQGSGGGDDRDLFFSQGRYYASGAPVWRAVE